MKKFLFIVIICFISVSAYPAEVIKGIFWGHGALVFDNQGNMYIGYDSHSITKYSPKGEKLLKIGRKGAGPGDLRRISRYAFNPKDNSLYVTEYYNGNRRVSRFGTNGKFKGAWNFEMNWSKYDVVSNIGFDSSGNVMLTGEKSTPRRYKDFMISSGANDLLIFSPEGKFLRKIYNLKVDENAEKRGNYQANIPFQNYMSWIVCLDKIIVKETSGGFIKVFSLDGKLEKKIPFPIKSEPVTEKDLDVWEKTIRSKAWYKKYKSAGLANVNYWRKNLPFPKFKPNSYWRMITDSKGNLYVKENTKYKDKTPVWCKINIQTGKTDILKFKPDETFCQIWKNYFFFYKLVEVEDADEEIETIIKIEEKELFKR